MYDTNNDGVLREDDLREVLKAMIIENGMEFNDEEVQHVPQRIIFPLIYSYTSPQRSIFALISSYSSPQRCGTLLVFSSRTGARRGEIISLSKTSRSSCQGKGSCTYYVITDRGGSLQMITVLHRGGPANDYGITWGWCVK